MLSLEQFIQKYTGKICTHPQGISGQCVCLYRRYLDDVLDVPQSQAVTGAKDIWNKYRKEDFDRIAKTNFARPQKGDVVIFSAFPGNPYGHVGMCVSSGQFSFMSFDSNWSIPKKAKVENHAYTYVIGWLRPKKTQGLDVRAIFRSVWKREGATGEINYFLKRLELGSIQPTLKDITEKMSYWYGVVYPNGKYSLVGDARWQLEKLKYA